MTHEPNPDASVVYDFTERFLDDLERGTLRTLPEYIALFPGHEPAIRAEYAELGAEHGLLGHVAPDGQDGRSARRIGPYRLLVELGRGGQARVWLAEDARLSRKVALKVLDGALVGASHQRRERFRREAELVARLEHPGICGVLEADLDAELPWIAMRHVEGETLAAALEREQRELAQALARNQPHPLSGARLAERLSFFERTARALHAAHEAGVVHRDVKPGNLMVASDGAPVVLDFGLAYDEGDPSVLTRTGEVFGTPAYMAPEQLDGRKADRRTDVYGLGVVIYEALTLTRPFKAVSSEALARAIRSELPRGPEELNPHLPGDLAVVLATALEKEPARRYATALELAEELRRVREFEPILARPVSVFGRLSRWSRRHPVVAATTVGSILLLSLALIAALLFIQELRAQRNAKEHALVEKDAALGLYEGAWFRDLATDRVEVDPPEALRLAIASAERDPGLSSNRALLMALEGQHELATLSGHTDLITQLDVARANGCVATASLDGTARIWKAESGSALATLTGHTSRVWCVRFDPSGERVVTAGEDGTARIWRWAGAQPPLVLAGHTQEVQWAEFSADGRHVVTASRDHDARLWNADTGALEFVLGGHTGNVTLARFCAGDRYVITASGEPPAGSPAPESDHTLRLFEVATGRPVAVLAEHTEAIRSITLHPDGTHLVTTSDDASARLWDLGRRAAGEGVPQLESTRVFHLPGYGSSASFSPDGTRLALAYDSGARVVDVESGATLYELPDHDHRSIIDIAFDPSGSVLATAAFDNTVRIFEGAGPRQLVLCRGVPTRPRGIVWAPDGRWLASWQTTREAKVWYGRTRPFLSVLNAHAGALATARYDPAGRRVVTACADGHAAVFDARSGELVQRLEPASTAAALAADYDATGARVLVTSADGTLSVLRSADGALESSYAGLAGGPVASFLPDGARLVYLASTGEPVLVTLATGALVHLKGAHGHVISLCTSGDGTRVACGTDERTVHLWKLDGGQGELEDAWTFGPYEEANHKLNSVYNVALSADGRRLAATTQHLRTYLLDADDGQQLSEDISATVGNVAFTRDGHYLFATGKWTGFVRAYRLGGPDAAPFEVFALRDVAAWSRASTYRCLAVAPRGNLVVAGALDRTAKLWDLDSGECLAIYPGHADVVSDVDFAPDGASFVTASGDGTARIWPVDLLVTARASLPAGLSKPRELPRPKPRPR